MEDMLSALQTKLVVDNGQVRLQWQTKLEAGKTPAPQAPDKLQSSPFERPPATVAVTAQGGGAGQTNALVHEVLAMEYSNGQAPDLSVKSWESFKEAAWVAFKEAALHQANGRESDDNPDTHLKMKVKIRTLQAKIECLQDEVAHSKAELALAKDEHRQKEEDHATKNQSHTLLSGDAKVQIEALQKELAQEKAATKKAEEMVAKTKDQYWEDPKMGIKNVARPKAKADGTPELSGGPQLRGSKSELQIANAAKQALQEQVDDLQRRLHAVTPQGVADKHKDEHRQKTEARQELVEESKRRAQEDMEALQKHGHISLAF